MNLGLFIVSLSHVEIIYIMYKTLAGAWCTFPNEFHRLNLVDFHTRWSAWETG